MSNCEFDLETQDKFDRIFYDYNLPYDTAKNRIVVQCINRFLCSKSNMTCESVKQSSNSNHLIYNLYEQSILPFVILQYYNLSQINLFSFSSKILILVHDLYQIIKLREYKTICPYKVLNTSGHFYASEPISEHVLICKYSTIQEFIKNSDNPNEDISTFFSMYGIKNIYFDLVSIGLMKYLYKNVFDICEGIEGCKRLYFSNSPINVSSINIKGKYEFIELNIYLKQNRVTLIEYQKSNMLNVIEDSKLKSLLDFIHYNNYQTLLIYVSSSNLRELTRRLDEANVDRFLLSKSCGFINMNQILISCMYRVFIITDFNLLIDLSEYDKLYILDNPECFMDYRKALFTNDYIHDVYIAHENVTYLKKNIELLRNV